MKRFENIFSNLRLWFFAVLVIVDLTVEAKSTDATDSVEIGLITCSPHEEVYSLYGHSALRYHDHATGQDLVFNYGLFDPTKPNFMLRFIFGLTDYELGIVPTTPFCQYYRKWGSSVTEQVLNLTKEEKRRLTDALALNLRPDNRVYRYNIFYDNCSTRPRNIVENNIEGNVDYRDDNNDNPTFRQLIHELTRNHPWARFGNDMLLGAKADLPTTMRQREFLPLYLMADFDNALVERQGQVTPLVKEKRTLIPPGHQEVVKDFVLTPIQTFGLLLIIALFLFALETRRRRTFKYWDTLLMLLTGIAGCIILTMFFSQHPTTSTNLLIFLLNPLPLFYLRSILKRRPNRHFWIIVAGGIVLFFIGGLWQDYAEGMELLALCLLTRVFSNLRNDK